MILMPPPPPDIEPIPAGTRRPKRWWHLRWSDGAWLLAGIALSTIIGAPAGISLAALVDTVSRWLQ